MPFGDVPMDILPEYAVVWGLDLRALPPVIFSDREHLRELQLNDPVTGGLIRMIEGQEKSDTGELSQYTMQDEVSCSHHLLKQEFVGILPLAPKHWTFGNNDNCGKTKTDFSG